MEMISRLIEPSVTTYENLSATTVASRKRFIVHTQRQRLPGSNVSCHTVVTMCLLGRGVAEYDQDS
jgi:hypothetical protein